MPSAACIGSDAIDPFADDNVHGNGPQKYRDDDGRGGLDGGGVLEGIAGSIPDSFLFEMIGFPVFGSNPIGSHCRFSISNPILDPDPDLRHGGCGSFWAIPEGRLDDMADGGRDWAWRRKWHGRLEGVAGSRSWLSGSYWKCSRRVG